MALDKLTPDDPRIKHHTAALNGKNYHYLLADPQSGQSCTATVLLIHGFPDLSFAWRYQVPPLVAVNLRVIIPDMLGYGRTDAPEDPTEYAHKKLADDMAALVRHVDDAPVFLGGHDWGGALVWRIALWHPEIVRGVFSVCTPYDPPREHWAPDEKFFELLPNFRYQRQFASGKIEEVVGSDPVKLGAFLSGMYGARGPNNEVGFTTAEGVQLDKLTGVTSEFCSKEEMRFYVQEFARHGLRGPLNWYRTRRINWEDELALVKERTRIKAPALVLLASKDEALPPEMAKGMEKHFEKGLVKREIAVSHWALWEAAEEVTGHVVDFVEAVLKEDEELCKASI